MSNDFTRVALKFTQLAKGLSGSDLRGITGRVALRSKNVVLDEVAKDLGSDRRMSGWKKVQFGAGYEITSDSTAELNAKPAGPWSVLQFGRKTTHLPKKAKRKVYKTPYGLRAASKKKPWTVGKTAGKKTMDRASNKIADKLPAWTHEEVTKALQEAF